MGTYSIVYPDSYNPRGYCAVDWSWQFQGKWARSEKDWTFGPWVIEEGLDEEAYKELLEHFGLEQWTDKFPPERVISMSPRELAKERRMKEEEYRLPRKEMMSDTMGYRVRAEEHGS